MRELRFKGIVFENQVFKWLRESLFEVSFSHHLDTSCINEKLFPYSINKILAIASASFRPMKMSKSERQFSCISRFLRSTLFPRTFLLNRIEGGIRKEVSEIIIVVAVKLI